jgi:hypothetical protein
MQIIQQILDDALAAHRVAIRPRPGLRGRHSGPFKKPLTPEQPEAAAERIMRKGGGYALELRAALGAKLRELGVLALALVLLASPVSAQTTWYRDAQGRNAGRAEPGGPGVTRLYDRDGRHAGEVVQRPAPCARRPPEPPVGARRGSGHE